VVRDAGGVGAGVTAPVVTGLAPDPTFPRRDVLLDAEAMRERLSALLGTEVEACERLRATYHPGRSLRVLLRVRANGAARLAYARMFPRGTRSFPGGLRDEELSTVVGVFPADRKLAALPRFADARLVAYAPEKSATFAVRGAFVKLYADDAWRRTRRVHEALWARGVSVPAVADAWPESRALAVEAVRGEQPRDAEGYRAFGAALARLHGLRPLDARRSTRLEPESLREAATTIAAVRPDVGATAHALAAALGSATAGPIACLHGDVHPKNALVADGAATLVDLDDVTGGDVAVDLGSALAGIRYDGLFGDGDPARAGALLEGYAAHAALPREAALRRCTAAALLGERALRAVTRLRGPGLERLHDVLRAGLEELG
jgi:Phosphotransferase enzyme family